MAPNESVYFPPLEQCFNGTCRLLSWRSAVDALLVQSPKPYEQTLKGFLLDDASLSILKRPFQPFLTPTSETKASFETLTAAINITPSQHGLYDIAQIKEDAVWLSDKFRITELDALRIVVLEWQERPASKLLKDTPGGNDGFQGPVFGTSKLLQASSTIRPPNDAEFSAPVQRHSRMVNIYLFETTAIIRMCGILLRIAFYADDVFEEYGTYASHAKGKAPSHLNWIQELGAQLAKDLDRSPGPAETFQDVCIDTVGTFLKRIEEGLAITEEDVGFDVHDAIATSTLSSLLYLLQIIFTWRSDSYNTKQPASSIQAWFDLMLRYNFFNGVQLRTQDQQAFVPPLQALASLVSLQILRVTPILQNFRTMDPYDIKNYLTERKAVHEINSILFSAADSQEANPASLAVFGWAIVIHSWYLMMEEFGSAGDAQHSQGGVYTPIAENFDEVKNSRDDVDPLQFIIESAVQMQEVHRFIPVVIATISSYFGTRIDYSFRLEVRNALLGLINEGLVLANYSEPLLISTLSTLGEDGEFWDLMQPSPIATSVQLPADLALKDDRLKAELIQSAQIRYPYETTPFLKLCQALCNAVPNHREDTHKVTPIVDNLFCVAERMPEGMDMYELVREEENSNFVRLTRQLPLFGQRVQALDFGGFSPQDTETKSLLSEGTFSIPPGTNGQIVDDSSRPFIATWAYEYSGLRHLSFLLTTFSSSSNRVVYATEAPIAQGDAAEIIGFLATLLGSCVKDISMEAAKALLDYIGEVFDESEDLVAVVFAIFEQTLQLQMRDPESEGPIELLKSCTNFAYVVTRIVPNRIWPFLSRSSLLDINGSSCRLASIVSASEIVLGRYGFLRGCVHSFDALIEDAATSSTLRKMPSKQVTRFHEGQRGGSGATDKAMESALLAFTKIMTDVFQSASAWRFEEKEEQLDIETGIMRAFRKILVYVHGYDDDQEPAQKVTGALAASAEHLVGVFLASSRNDLALEPLIKSFAAPTMSPVMTLPLRLNVYWTQQSSTALSFSLILLRVSMQLDLKRPRLETLLFEACPTIAHLFLTNVSLRIPVIELLETLVLSAGRREEEPPSLMGHIGVQGSMYFVEVLSNLGKPVRDVLLEVKIWRFLSAIVSNRQQWFSIYLLTGQTGRSTKKDPDGAQNARSRPLLQYALGQLGDPENIKDTSRAAAIFEFIALAQDNWPWAVKDIRKHPTFIKSITASLDDLQASQQHSSSHKSMRLCDQNRKAAYIADILAMCLYEARQLGDVSLAKDLASKLYYYRDHAIGGADEAYNESLNTNLSRNLQMKYSINPKIFKRTALTATTENFGESYFYALEYADAVFGSDAAWSRASGFRSEFQAANINLSLVESHVNLLNSWKNLALELSKVLVEEPRLQMHLAKVAKECIRTRAKSSLPANLSTGLTQTRLDLAFALTKKLIEAKSKESDVRSLFSGVWEAMRTSDIDVETALTGKDGQHFRDMLRMLFLSLQPHLEPLRPEPPKDASVSIQHPSTSLSSDFLNDVYDVLSKVICAGWRTLCSTLHHSSPNDALAVIPTDFTLLTALLQTIFAIPGIPSIDKQLYLLVTSHGTIRQATALYTWADQLAAPPTYDPIFASHATQFLLELSSIPSLAQEIAVEGVLTTLSGAELSNTFRRPGGTGPLDGPGQGRMYSVWYRGFLPLCLNLLKHVGAPIVAEICGFLNGFPAQLGRAAKAVESDGTEMRAGGRGGLFEQQKPMTLGVASEVHSLCLITLLLEKFRLMGPAAGLQDGEVRGLDGAWNWVGVRDDLETWLSGSKRGLRERIVPVDEKEAGLARMKARGRDFENRLEERVVGELERAAECLKAITEL
ncbi:MAG: hypothetical protein M1820_003424 [Bogoriella megaspora]|nr:MAG: hypothetical protein M1820_003424 [Bogoriella megaspora]